MLSGRRCARGRVMFAMLAMAAVSASAPAVRAGAPVFVPERGTWQFTVESPHQKGPNVVEVLLPRRPDPAARHRVLYVLPVETGLGGRYGDGLMEVAKAGVHDRESLICATMAFDTVPWYGAHDTDKRRDHERYILDVVVPLMDERYPTVRRPEGRLLLGFSKSGWGAITLILRNPDVFGFAASWDAPLMLDEADFGVYGTGEHFGSRDNFARYMPARLMERQAALFRDRPRLAILGERNFGSQPGGRYGPAGHTAAAHRRLAALGVPHTYSAELKFAHSWGSGWVEPALRMLLEMSRPAPAGAKEDGRPQ